MAVPIVAGWRSAAQSEDTERPEAIRTPFESTAMALGNRRSSAVDADDLTE